MLMLLKAIPWDTRSLPEQLSLVAHITAGSIAIITGFTALFVKKGGAWHRKNGVLFTISMLAMGLMGAFVAATFNRAFVVNFPAGLTAAYFVATAYTTVNEDSRFASRPWALALFVVASFVGLYNLSLAGYAIATGKRTLFGLPLFPYFVFGILGSLAALGDARVMRNGALTGARRLARHLWRMNLSLFIAAGSFFLGQAKVIPEPLRIWPLLFVPPLIAVLSIPYWLWRVRYRKSLKGIALRVPEPVPGQVVA